jgi:hypothetical protein
VAALRLLLLLLQLLLPLVLSTTMKLMMRLLLTVAGSPPDWNFPSTSSHHA